VKLLSVATWGGPLLLLADNSLLEIPTIYLASSRQRQLPGYFLHLFHSEYGSFTFRALPVVVQFRLARLHNPDRDKLSRSSICQTTREVRICRFYLFSVSRKCADIPRISKGRWKDHKVTQVCPPCAPHALQLCSWRGYRPGASQGSCSHFISMTHVP